MGLIRIRVSPGAKRSAVVGRHGDGWKARVAAPPEGGRANAELIRLLSAMLDVPERSISIVSGRRSRDKLVAVEGIGSDEAARRLEAARTL
jgi:uncharacterized protein (TIGR00251 family)